MDELLAGVAVRDITPAAGFPMWGYSDRAGGATGTLDPLHARAIVFRAAERSVAMVSLELGRVPTRNVCARIRDRVLAAGVDYVFLAATHTHHGPVMEVESAPCVADIERAIGDCIEEAAGRLAPARIGIGRTAIDIAHNRREVRDDGFCYMRWRNESHVPTEPVDPEAVVIKMADPAGQPLATLVHFACHPVVMGPSNRQYSADYTGEMARIVKETTGAECLFFQGACGNLNPFLDKTTVDEGAVEAMRGVGREAAECVLAAWAAIEPEAPAHPSVSFVHKDVPVGVRWDLSAPGQEVLFRKAHGDLFDYYFTSLDPDLAVPLAVVVLNKAVAFVGMPGEIFVQFQRELKMTSPLRDTLLCGYANDYHAYFPTVRDAVAGGYGGVVASYVGLGAGDRLTTEALVEIARLLGKAGTTCTPEDFLIRDADGQRTGTWQPEA